MPKSGKNNGQGHGRTPKHNNTNSGATRRAVADKRPEEREEKEREGEGEMVRLVDVDTVAVEAKPPITNIPYFEEEDNDDEDERYSATNVRDDDDEGPPIPIPVPRSQTPQFSVFDPFVMEQEAQRHVEDDFTFSPSPAAAVPLRRPTTPVLNHLVDQAPKSTSTSTSTSNPAPVIPDVDAPSNNPFSSYGYTMIYGQGLPPTIDPPRYLPSSKNSKGSGISRTIPSTSPSSSMSHPAPAPAPAPPAPAPAPTSYPHPHPHPYTTYTTTTPAVPVIDLGTAGVDVEGISRSSSYGGHYQHQPPPHQHHHHRRQSQDQDEDVLWGRWDLIPSPSPSSQRRFLIISYPSTLRIWDMTHLNLNGNTGGVEVGRVKLESFFVGDDLNRGEGVVVVVDAKVLRGGKEDGLGLVLGLAFSTGLFVVYSLKTHRVLTRFQVGGSTIDSFQSSQDFFVISTSSPPSLHIHSSLSFNKLFEIPKATLALWTAPNFGEGAGAGSGGGSGLGLAGLGFSREVQAQAEQVGRSAKALLSSAFRGAMGMTPTTTTTTSPTTMANQNPNPNLNVDSMYYTTATPAISNNTNNTTSPTMVDDDNANVNNNKIKPNVSLSPFSEEASASSLPAYPHPIPVPRPIFALSHRLLAYASTTPTTASLITSTSTSTSTSHGHGHGHQKSKSQSQSQGQGQGQGSRHGRTTSISGTHPNTNANSNSPLTPTTAAQTVWDGMRTLGGLAVNAARSRMAVGGGGLDASSPSGSGPSSLAPAPAAIGPGGGGGMGRFFSRSAPAESAAGGGMGMGKEGEEEDREDVGFGGAGVNGGEVYIRVIDLNPLLDYAQSQSQSQSRSNTMSKSKSNSNSKKPKPKLVLEFAVGKDHRGVSKISFSKDGCSIGVVGRDGTGVKVYQVRPRPSFLPIPTPTSTSDDGVGGDSDPVSIADAEGAADSDTAEDIDTIEPGISGAGAAWNVYNLKRGRTNAVVEAMDWSADGRWVAMGTRKRTIHVFGVNPYGGKMDLRSHWEGRVRNVGEIQPMPVEMGPLVRLRAGAVPALPATHIQGQGHGQLTYPPPPLSFTFIEPNESLPKHLLPQHLPSSPPSLARSRPRSYSSQQHMGNTTTDSRIVGSPTTTTTTSATTTMTMMTNDSSGSRPKNYQDVLVFDPVDVSVSLRRIVLVMRPKEQGIGIGIGGIGIGGIGIGSLGSGMTSISLPGMGFAGSALSLGSSVSSSSNAGGGGGGTSSFGQSYEEKKRMRRKKEEEEMMDSMETQMELVGKESTVVSWSLGSWSGPKEIKKVVVVCSSEREVGRGKAKAKGDYLSQAELSTFSKSTKVLPRPIYLSHQFSFYTLGEDYHALIRRYQFDVGGPKVEVRREVQVNAFVGGGESFVEGDDGGGRGGGGRGGGGGFSTSPREIRHTHSHSLSHGHGHGHGHFSTSFDEPLASALSNDLSHSNIHGVLPMLPNGIPGSNSNSTASHSSSSFRNAIPITTRTIGDGVSEGLGRLRREIVGKVKVRSPKLRPRPDDSGGGLMTMPMPSVPLEFDEEDEDFVGAGVGVGVGVGVGALLDIPAGEGASSSRETSQGGESGRAMTGTKVSTPATSEEDYYHDEVVEDSWGGWSEKDRGAVEEVERFDDIESDVLGLLDEEQQQRGRKRG